ncbi:MAG: alkaline phosphatase family protein [Aliidongia sp.]
MNKTFARRLRDQAVVSGTIFSLLAAQGAAAQVAPNDPNTVTPIKHVIVIIGENRTFDHVFGTYEPKSGESVLNLVSQGIVRADGTPGPNFNRITSYGQPIQWQGSQPGNYTNSPTKVMQFSTLPAPGAAGAPKASSDTDPPPFATLEAAANYEITTGATGLAGTSVPDTRITNDASLPNGPFQLSGTTLPYDAYTGSPVHRFYQMWQQTDCSVAHATTLNPTGCLSDLFPVDRSDGRHRQQRRRPAARLQPVDLPAGRRRHLHGVLEHGAGRRAVFQVAG